ncbi:CzcE family metal-binding protein [Glaciimonas sp. Gout2]|uniref:CzcE family metal-binding protein n=1 Tax=unclassified Glaciimonas TaxID=2644401 RepID=UPI002B235FFD|nr:MULTISPECIES: CzcE family metal-binding protein [unclassified Glaciimonas]MEB0011218.1 CzcE family metal-binding protein [Glaciimonas sp. Cout2]MEB0084561.1 CzcE family metal-binding protein [Glaciimonas sp. Gout2]
MSKKLIVRPSDACFDRLFNKTSAHSVSAIPDGDHLSRLPSLLATLMAALLITVCALLSAPASAATITMVSLGSAASARSATVTVRVDPTTTHVNVTDGTTVNFVVGSNAFAWRFDVPHNVFLFDLNRIAPPNVVDHQVEVYVAPSMLSIF